VQPEKTPRPTESAISSGLECSLLARSQALRTADAARPASRARTGLAGRKPSGGGVCS